jgi:7-carboxy-7-deazaguanine synthase
MQPALFLVRYRVCLLRRPSNGASPTSSAKVDSLGCGLVEITGGEPLLQAWRSSADRYAPRTRPLGDDRNVGRAGHQHARLRASFRIVDLKCPGSGESARNLWSNLEHLTLRVTKLKFVLTDRRDYEWAREVILTHRLSERVNAVLLSPVFGKLEPSELAAWILD